jgi:tRNA G10  N-methylase Trm11
MESLLILGRQPKLGIAELESLYGPAAVRPISDSAAVVSVDPCLLAFDRLGGSTKFAKVLMEMQTTKWDEIESYLLKVSPEHSKSMSPGKMKLGLSLYGFNETNQRIGATGLKLKKAIQKTGRSLRYIPNKTAELNSAQVIHNRLTDDNGWELLFIKNGDKTLLAQTIKVQNIDSYALRDRKRPHRDTRVGMLPPKLAQIIINLSVGSIPETELKSICDIPAGEEIPLPILNKTILDPFCGTGVILQEGMLMGYGVYGTDREPKMIDYSKKNCAWLMGQFKVSDTHPQFDIADATSYKWANKFDYVASEVYLGKAFNSQPSQGELRETMADCQLITRKFLKNLHGQIESGTRMCLAVPAWQVKQNQFQHLPLIDQLDELGYTRISFEHAGNEELIYYRSDQIVARQLLVLIRK